MRTTDGGIDEEWGEVYRDGDEACPERPPNSKTASGLCTHTGREPEPGSGMRSEQEARTSEHTHEAEEGRPRGRGGQTRRAAVRSRGRLRASGGAGRRRRRRRARRIDVRVGAHDELCSLLREAVRRRHQMRGELEGEHGRVRDAHVRQAVDLEVRADDTALRLRQHRARARRVVLCVYVVLQPCLPLVVALHARARADLLAHVRTQRQGVPELAAEPEALAERRDI